MNNEDKRTKQIRFEFRCIMIPYTVLLLSYCYLIYFILTLK